MSCTCCINKDCVTTLGCCKTQKRKDVLIMLLERLFEQEALEARVDTIEVLIDDIYEKLEKKQDSTSYRMEEGTGELEAYV